MSVIETEGFGLANGRHATLYTLRSAEACVSLCDFGCTLTGFTVLSRSGGPVDIVRSYPDAGCYEKGSSCLGATVGRYAGRLGGSVFSLDGKEFLLEKNDGDNHLHGGFGKRFWSVEQTGDALRFSLVSPDMDESFPGELRVSFTAELSGRRLRLTYEAVCDAPTVLNLTNHSYFNLNGCGDAQGHYLRVYSDEYAELGPGMIPTGRLLPVDGTPFDFTGERRIGDVVSDERLAHVGGLDHSFALPHDGELIDAAEVFSPETGLRLICRTTQPSVHVYTANFLHLDSVGVDKNGEPLQRFGGVCLETQHFPDSPNKKEFPSTVLRPGERFREVTEYEVV